MKWAYLMNWAGWWLVKDSGLQSQLCYGPFYTAFELEGAAMVHDVPLPPEAVINPPPANRSSDSNLQPPHRS